MADAPNFMVIDENPNNALFWEMTVKEGFPTVKVTTCKTGFEALETAKKGSKFEFFVTSWEIKPMSGLVFMQKLKEINRYRYVPVLVFSNVLSEEDLGIASEFGITNYLLRPFEKARVIEKIKEMIEAEEKLDNTQRLLRKIEDWIADGKINEALKLINDVLKPGTYAAKAYALNGDIWARTEYLDKSEKSYKESLRFEDNNAHAMNGLGKLYLKMKKYKDAVDLFEKLHAQKPGNIRRMLDLGTAYLGNGEDDKAEAMFKQVNDMDTGNGDAREGMGKVAFNKGKFELAAQFFRESGKGDDLASYFNNMAIAMVNQGKHNDAITLYRNALGVLPSKSKNHLLEFNIGLAFKKSERFGEASEAFARSIMENPKYEKSFAALVFCVKAARDKKQKVDEDLVKKAVDKYKSNMPERDKEAG